MKKILKKGFTLIELLIVIGILGILIAAVLFTLNPAEGQRKARDVQRLKDLGTLQVIMEQLVSSNNTALTADLPASSGTGTNAGKTDCATNWLGIDICSYATKLPKDPINKSTKIAGSTTACNSGTTSNANAYYYIFYQYASNTYEIGVVQESVAGCSKIEGDGGNSFMMVEGGTASPQDLLGDPTTSTP